MSFIVHEISNNSIHFGKTTVKNTHKGDNKYMSTPYCCPNCRTNRTRFNIIEQVVQAVKLDPQSGAIVETFEENNAGPFHTSYNGPDKRIQCGSCGLIEDERTFIKFGEK